MALNHFENCGYLLPEEITGSGTLSEGEIDVEFQAHFPGRGNLFLPVNKTIRENLLSYVFPEFE